MNSLLMPLSNGTARHFEVPEDLLRSRLTGNWQFKDVSSSTLLRQTTGLSIAIHDHRSSASVDTT